MDTALAKNLIERLFLMLEAIETENEALRVMLRLHGVRHKDRQAKLNVLRESPAIKRRVHKSVAPATKAIAFVLGEIEAKETLAKLPVKGDKLQ